MIQFNLLPDIKLEYIRTRRLNRLITVVSVLVTALAVLITVVLFINVKVIQSNHLNNLKNSIKSSTTRLQSNTNFNKILTVQNQLASLPALNNQKPLVSRLIGFGSNPGFLSSITPNSVSLGSITTSFTTHTLTLQGTATNVYAVNQYVDTLKFTKYYINGNKADELNAFSAVTLSGFGAVQSGSTSYSITLTFDPNLFDSTKQISLDVPNIITTRAEIDTPAVLFNGTTGNNSQSTNSPTSNSTP